MSFDQGASAAWTQRAIEVLTATLDDLGATAAGEQPDQLARLVLTDLKDDPQGRDELLIGFINLATMLAIDGAHARGGSVFEALQRIARNVAPDADA